MFRKEAAMVKLYKFDKKKDVWVLADYGLKSKVREYIRQGYVVVYI